MFSFQTGRLLTMFFSSLVFTIEGQQYNLSRSSEFASLEESFTWTCEMFIPPERSVSVVSFYRNNVQCGVVGLPNGVCRTVDPNSRYIFNCSSIFTYTLTIPAENMTEYEQGSVWRCQYPGDSNFRSPNVTLEIAIPVYNVSLIPNDNKLTIREGSMKEIHCEVNINVYPAPGFFWYVASIQIVNAFNTGHRTAVTITGNKVDNEKTLQCRVANNNNPPKTATTTLNIEYNPSVSSFTQQNISEGNDLLVTCQAIPGNPNSTTFFWTKTGYQLFRQSGANLLISDIQRNSSGTYRCTAENTYSDGVKGTDSQDIFVNVLFPPNVMPLTRQIIVEGRDLSVTCQAIPGNPNSTTFFWTKTGYQMFRQSGANLLISDIQRNSSGTYRCTAENTYSDGVKGTDSQDIFVNVLFPPNVMPLTRQIIVEGRDLSVTCQAIPGNPNSTTFFWTKTGYQMFRQSGANLLISDIQRNSSGTYRCTAENTYSDGVKGTDSQDIFVNVLFPPNVMPLTRQIIVEGRDLSVTCQARPGNPNSTTFFWTKVDQSGFRQNGPVLQLPNINRRSSGTYRCTAENTYYNGKNGNHGQDMIIHVLFPPFVMPLNDHTIVEGGDLSVTCQAMPGNPSSTTFFWTKVDNSGFRQNGARLQLPNMNRSSSGTYRCTAENTYYDGKKGNNSQDMFVNILYKPAIKVNPLMVVNETDTIVMTGEIMSNPLANISWYDGERLLKTRTFTQTTILVLKNVSCLDTKNYTLVVSNVVQENVTAIVELIVNCKPIVENRNISLGVAYAKGIHFSTTIIAYPQPQYVLEQEDGTRNIPMTNSIQQNAKNNFTIQFTKTAVKPCDLGKYYLRVSNTFGEITIIISIFQQENPYSPGDIRVTCDISSALVQWKSSFNGGDPQSFTVTSFNSQQGTHYADRLLDRGEDKIHELRITNLLSSMSYMFYVTAQNSHGHSSSEIVSCTTLKESGYLTKAVGGGVGGTLALIMVVSALVVVVHRSYTFEIRFKKRNKILYDGSAKNDNINQYDSIKEPERDTRNTYEVLQIHDDSDDLDPKHQKISLDTQGSVEQSNEKNLLQTSEEYANTSFIN